MILHLYNFILVAYLLHRYNDIMQPSHFKSADENILKQSENMLNNLLLYCEPQFDSNKNSILVNTTIR